MAADVSYINDVRQGDTVKARVFTLTSDGSPYDRNHRLTLSIGSGITVTDAAGGVFQIDAFDVEHAGVWEFKIEFVTPGTPDITETLFFGTLTVLECP
ncbi:MAG: hypothetical protein HRU13_11680 [Phycisphaerales bacterium]|nr:hypothetical protein [Phycisphaerales bacterium]